MTAIATDPAPEQTTAALPATVDTRFGSFAVDPERVITFAPGPLGFADRKRFVLADLPEPGVPFKLLQCLDDPELAFVVLPLDPREGPISASDLEAACQAEAIARDALAVLGIVTVRAEDDGVHFTVNLRAPILIDTARRTACQHVMADDQYALRHPLPATVDRAA